MKKWLAGLVCMAAGATMAMGQLVISQYVETDSGTAPKGIEIWNAGAAAIDFSVTGLDVLKGANGAALSSDFTLNTGTLAAGAVMVVGTSDMVAYVEALGTGILTAEKGFTFNGDDALQVQLGGVVQDTFGDPGTGDPGDSWSGNGVSTANQNIQILDGISTGDTDGWTDPSTRFETVSETPSAPGGLAGFGVAPGPVGFGVSLDKQNGFTVDQGTSDTITATAQNGTEPYAYQWATDMAVGDYTASGDTFTIAAAAAVGDYYATVTATDGASETAEKTVTFSVVVPPTYYDITITPPVNGSVTTTPESQAAETSTVTINASATSGYAVGTITVTAADSSDVPVNGTTFTMPSQNVTVTVTFVEFTGSDLIISEVADPSDNWEQGRFVELYNAGGSSIDLAAGTWTLARQANGGSWGSLALTGTVAPGETYVIAYSADFGTAYPAAPAGTPHQISGLITGNGDDGYYLYSGGDNVSGTLEDAYGVIDEDGSGMAWEYTDSRAVRNTEVTAGNPTWTAGEWTIASAGVADMTPGVHPDGAAVLAVIFDKTDGFVVAEGASDAITATALHGTAPYAFVWSSSLDTAHYTTNADVFTILATAPLGTYSATVEVTDDAAAQATNTLTFSVVEPLDITITPPSNGTVTTDPTDAAIQGATVTITATPDPNYAVGTITVVDASLNPVALNGFTFTMPDSAVTVTVTFVLDIAALPIAENYTETMDWQTLPGWSGVSMSTYADGSMSFNDSGDQLTVHFDGEPGQLTFDLKGNASTAGTAPMQYDVEESADGETWTTVDSIDDAEVSATVASFGPYVLQSASRYVRWNYVNKFAFNLALNNVAIGPGGPFLSYTGATTIQMGGAFALVFTLNGGSASGWEYTLESAERVEIDSGSVNTFTWTPSSAGTYYLTMSALDEMSDPIATREVTLTVTPVDPGDPQVTITGDLTGTVGEAMNLTIALINSDPPADWYLDLTDPVLAPVLIYNWNPATGAFSFTPSTSGTYVLTATAVDGSMATIASKVQDLLVSGGGESPPIPAITFVAGTGLQFDLSAGHAVSRMEAAGTTTDANGEFIWSAFTDYTVNGSTVTIDSEAGAAAQMIRVYFTVTP